MKKKVKKFRVGQKVVCLGRPYHFIEGNTIVEIMEVKVFDYEVRGFLTKGVVGMQTAEENDLISGRGFNKKKIGCKVCL